jgi:hypothetical protein
MSLEAIDRKVQSKVKVTFKTLELVFPEPGVATFARSRSMKFAMLTAVIVFAVLMAGCPLFLIFGRFFEFFGTWIFAFLIAFEVISLLCLAASLVVHFRVRPLVFDNNQGRMWRQGKADPIIGDYAALRDIEAVQVCSAIVSPSEGRPYPVYELDVVMRRPAGARLAAMCHGKRDAMFSDARKLCEFLGVPLLDHADDLLDGKLLLKK